MEARRDSEASAWLQQLDPKATGPEPYLVRGSGGGLFVIDSDRRRAVSSGLLAAALEQRLGKARVVDPEQLHQWQPGPPIEVLEGPKGPPFIIVGGRRRKVRGLPLPHPVGAAETERFREGPEIDVAGANVSRARFETAVSGKYHIERVRAVIAREGPVKGTGLLARRGAERVRRLFG
ncbi:MAG: hypothetical protein ACRDWD_04680 [Acidimicrobiia bacterium]